MNSVLDDKLTLHDLLDPSVLKEVCEAFSQCFSIGVHIISNQGEELLSSCPENDRCHNFQNGPEKTKCDEVRTKLIAHPLESSRVFQTRAFCGMLYAIFPVFYELEPVGRVVMGPFRNSARDLDPADEKSADKTSAPIIGPDRLKLIIRLLARCLDAYLFINAKRLITTRFHLETIYGSRDTIFREVERQDQRTREDKEEIDKLKNLF